MKLKKKLMLLEDFETGTTQTTNATATNNATEVKTEVKSGENIRTEVIADVDAILTNLETLSTQITEEHKSLLEEFEKTTNIILEDTEMVNEDFMAEIMKQVKSMKSYAKLSGLYPKMKKNILKAELTKIDKLGEFEAAKAEKTANYTEELKAAFKEKIDKITASDQPAIKKTQQKEALRQARDTALEKGSASVAAKLEAAKAKLTKKFDDKIRDLNTKLSDLESNNKIEAELLSKQWQVEKIKHNDKFEFEKIDKELEIKNKYQEDNPEQVEKRTKLAKELTAKVKAESEERAKEKAEELAAIKKQFDDEKNAGTEDEKEAKSAITTWMDAGNAYASYLGSVDFGIEESMVTEAEISDEVKARIKELRKAYNDANSAVTVSTFKKAGASEDDAEEQFTTFKKMVQASVEEYGDQVDSIEGIDDEEPTTEDQTKSAEEVATEELGDAKADYTKIDNPDETEPDTTDADGNTVPGRKKWTGVRRFNGKDAEGKPTDEEVIYAKENSSESAPVANGTSLNEGMSVAEKFAILMNR